MRIGIEMLAVQSPGSRLRGIGRYGMDLVLALIARGDGHEYVLYAHDGLPTDALATISGAAVRLLTPDARSESDPRDTINRVARDNPDRLDVRPAPQPPRILPGIRPAGRASLSSLTMAAVVYDLIPFLNPEHYFTDPWAAPWFYRRLGTLQKYHALLSISDATRADCLAKLAVPPDRVVTISVRERLASSILLRTSR